MIGSVGYGVRVGDTLLGKRGRSTGGRKPRKKEPGRTSGGVDVSDEDSSDVSKRSAPPLVDQSAEPLPLTRRKHRRNRSRYGGL